MAFPETYQDVKGAWLRRCPVTHPRVIPSIAFNVHTPITDPDQLNRWALSSDMDMTQRGASGHADWFMGWDTTTINKIVNNCLRQPTLDCHANLLGDGTMLY
jgi:hypothetical protein